MRVYSYESDVIPVNTIHNDFTFEIHGEAIAEVRFDGESARVEKAEKPLHMRNWGGGEPKEMIYVKN